MQINELRNVIMEAFQTNPYPGDDFDKISATTVDEDIVECFRGSTWAGHLIADLRKHHVALTFFTIEAFRYWLPAFMLAELEDPDEADIIAEHIAWNLSDQEYGPDRLSTFSQYELMAVSAFLRFCEDIYEKSENRELGFRKAASVVEKYYA